MFTFPSQHLIAVKGVWEGRGGGLSLSGPMHVATQHPGFLPRLCWAPRVQLEEPHTFVLQMLQPSARQPPAAANTLCPQELSSHQEHGVHRAGDDIPAGATPKWTSAQRHCRGTVTLPCSFWMVSALSGCSLLLPK